MSSERNPIVVLLADDNDEGRMLACDALTESRLPNAAHCADGEDSLDYLRSHGQYRSPAETPRPVIVSLDLNLPKMDGREALREIKDDPLLRQNPVLVMNTSKTEEGVFHCFDSGASAYLSKAVTSEGIVDVMKSLGRFWFEIVDLPREDEPCQCRPPAETAQRNLMNDQNNRIVILLADDDEEDRLMTCDAIAESQLLPNDIYCVTDGEELMDYLHRSGKYAPPAEAPRPGLILLDLNMPKKDGREALREIKADPNLKQIAVVVLTTSKVEEDIMWSYDSGASSFISKPVTFDGLVELLNGLGRYQFEVAELP